MATTTIGFGAALVILGLVGYFGTDRISITALIPALFGALLILFGALARDDKRRKVAMHIAVTVGLIGFLGAVASAATSSGTASTAAVASKITMAALLAVYVALCVKSFIDARRKRAGA